MKNIFSKKTKTNINDELISKQEMLNIFRVCIHDSDFFFIIYTMYTLGLNFDELIQLDFREVPTSNDVIFIINSNRFAPLSPYTYYCLSSLIIYRNYPCTLFHIWNDYEMLNKKFMMYAKEVNITNKININSLQKNYENHLFQDGVTKNQIACIFNRDNPDNLRVICSKTLQKVNELVDYYKFFR